MTLEAPPIDPRTAGDVVEQVRNLLQHYVPAYAPVAGDPTSGLQDDPPRDALVGVFGRLAELVIERLNRVPGKSFLAFLDLIGASRLPPQPARVPLTFSLAAGSAVPVVVPAGTQVAAAPAPGGKAPTIFETERELVVTPAALTAVFTRDPEADAYADQSGLARQAAGEGAPFFRGDRPIEHVLYLGLDRFLELTGLVALTLDFTIAQPVPSDERRTQWERWDGSAWQPLALLGADPTNGLRQSGVVQLMPPEVPVPPGSVGGIASRWIRCRLLTPMSRAATARLGMVRGSAVRAVQSLTAAVSVKRTNLTVDAAFTNQTPIDIDKDFFPFGEVPRTGDVFWLRADEAFSKPGARVVLQVAMRKASTKALRVPTLAWELWNGSAWELVGTSRPTTNLPSTFVETTKAMTSLTAAGDRVELQVPAVVGPRTVNGVEGFWLRARLVSGDYGQDAHYVQNGDTIKFVLADLDPPVIAAVTLDYELVRSGAPDAAVTDNDFHIAPAAAGFVPFTPTDDARPTTYLGFELPRGLSVFPNRPVSLFARAADVRYGEPTVPLSPGRSRRFGPAGADVTHGFVVTNPGPQPSTVSLQVLGSTWAVLPGVPTTLTLAAGGVATVPLTVSVPASAPTGAADVGLLAVTFPADPGRRHVAAFATLAAVQPPADDPVRLAWEYWDGTRWASLLVEDDASLFARSGNVAFLAPPRIATRADFGTGSRYWVRVRWDEGEYLQDPRLSRLLPNTTMASQTVTVGGEGLGTSDGSKGQRFRTTRKPVLPGQSLEVREQELPPAGERAVLESEEGKDAITVVLDADGRPKERWVRWHEVPDFYASGPRDRHYVLDRFTGEVRLGDGQNGLVPGIGSSLRMARYRTGGGSAGNRPAGVVVQLKTAVPYVDKVTNLEPAAGGADAEPEASVLERAPRTLRHGGRAVTLEDFQDQALLATPEVARAKSVPLANLVEDPFVADPATPGELSVVIVPRSTAAKPLPSLELLGRVQDHLDRLRVPTARLSVVGPLYVRVNVDAVVAVASLEGATDVVSAVERTVTAFLHPLTGGLDGLGWDFGRRPHLSDVYALIEAVPGVDHVRSLDVVEEEDPPGAAATGRFLVYAGALHVGLVLEEV